MKTGILDVNAKDSPNYDMTWMTMPLWL